MIKSLYHMYVQIIDERENHQSADSHLGP